MLLLTTESFPCAGEQGLISNTSTRKGLKVRAVLDENEYEAGKEISEIELAGLNLLRDNFHPEWNYTIIPRDKKHTVDIL